MTAPSRAQPRAPGPSSESLQGRNPRDVGDNGAAGFMGISTAPSRLRLRMTRRTERLRRQAVVAMRPELPDNKGPRPIWALQNPG